MHSSEARIDPVGACVGLRGNRVKTIVRELNGEKIDIVDWSADIRKFAENALKPAKLSSITVEEANKTLRIKVAEDQLSLSIGRKGQNARLASKLLGWKIDISKAESEPEETPQDDYETLYQQAVNRIAEACGIQSEQAETLVQNGFNSLEVIVTVNQDDIAELEGIGEELAEHIVRAAKEHAQS